MCQVILNARRFGSQLARSCKVFLFHAWKKIVVSIPTSFCHKASMAGLVPFTMGYTVGKSVPEFCSLFFCHTESTTWAAAPWCTLIKFQCAYIHTHTHIYIYILICIHWITVNIEHHILNSLQYPCDTPQIQDVMHMRKQTNMFAHDPGHRCTASRLWSLAGCKLADSPSFKEPLFAAADSQLKSQSSQTCPGHIWSKLTILQAGCYRRFPAWVVSGGISKWLITTSGQGNRDLVLPRVLSTVQGNACLNRSCCVLSITFRLSVRPSKLPHRTGDEKHQGTRTSRDMISVLFPQKRLWMDQIIAVNIWARSLDGGELSWMVTDGHGR